MDEVLQAGPRRERKSVRELRAILAELEEERIRVSVRLSEIDGMIALAKCALTPIGTQEAPTDGDQ
jgi:hypothetical protein